MNHAAVKAVSMRTLNRQRANIVLSTLISHDKVLTPEEVSKRERIFEWDGVLRWEGARAIGKAKIGVSLQTLLDSLGSAHSITKSHRAALTIFGRLEEMFRFEEYIVWYDSKCRVASIVLKLGASSNSQLKAWAHALWIAQRCEITHATGAETNDQAMLQLLKSTVGELSRRWDKDLISLKTAGWDLGTASLETTSATRISLAVDDKWEERPK